MNAKYCELAGSLVLVPLSLRTSLRRLAYSGCLCVPYGRLMPKYWPDAAKFRYVDNRFSAGARRKRSPMATANVHNYDGHK